MLQKGIRSDQISRSVVSDSLPPHESQHARLPCPSPTPWVHSDSRPSSQWCHPAISSSGVPFSSCPQSLPASESFPLSQLFAWGGLPSPSQASEKMMGPFLCSCTTLCHKYLLSVCFFSLILSYESLQAPNHAVFVFPEPSIILYIDSTLRGYLLKMYQQRL